MAAAEKKRRVVVDLDDSEGGAAKESIAPWWTLDKEAAGPALAQTYNAIITDQQEREQQMLRQAILHENQRLGSLYELAAPRRDSRIGPWNVCKAATRTAKSMICRSPVKVRIDTSAAHGSTQRLAREGTRWLYGVFEENRLHTDVAPDCFQDAGVLDTGFSVVRIVRGRERIQRWFPWEVAISEDEGLYGDPSAIQLVRWMTRHQLIDELGLDVGSKSKEIKEVIQAVKECRVHNDAFHGTRLQKAVPVYFGWKKRGKHVMSLPQTTLVYTDWDEDFLPVVPWYIERPQAGMWGEGYVQTLMGYQCEIYALNDAIEEHWRLMSSRKVIFEQGCGINEDDWDNEIASTHWIAKGSAEPKLWGPESIPGELLEERQRTYDAALNEVGMNQWSIAAQEPANRSGKGMEIARDKERGRLLTAGNSYEQSHVNLAEICLRMGKYTSGPVNGRIPGDKELEPVDFKDISELIANFPWRVRKTPVSALPDSPDERRQVVEKWVEIGLVTAESGQSLLDLLDVDYESDLMGAAREEVMHYIEQILVKGRDGYEPPDPMSNLEMGMRMMTAARSRAKRQGVEEEKLDLMQLWVDEALVLLGKKPAMAPSPELRVGVGDQPQAAPLPNRAPAPALLGPDGQPLPPSTGVSPQAPDAAPPADAGGGLPPAVV